MSPWLDRVPAPVLRVTVFTGAAIVVYLLLLGIGALVFSPAALSGSGYGLTSIIAAALAAYYLVYRGGLARLRDLLS